MPEGWSCACTDCANNYKGECRLGHITFTWNGLCNEETRLKPIKKDCDVAGMGDTLRKDNK